MSHAFLGFILFVGTLKILHDLHHLWCVRTFLRAPRQDVPAADASLLLLIPVIREQRVICQTLSHFLSLDAQHIHLYLAVAGTSREQKITGQQTTKEVVKAWLHAHPLDGSGIRDLFFCEKEETQGDRATQLNHAVQSFHARHPDTQLDYLGVYDADSLPSVQTLQEVVQIFAQRRDVVACQQPVHFVRAANRMAQQGKHPLLVANALYQSTWTMIRELPSWIENAATLETRMFHENVYLIGHGEFLRMETYKAFHFPEFEITDGIQLGYRLGMANQRIAPLYAFCDDDVPQSLSQLIQQHKRWFGGCMNLVDAFRWARTHFGTCALGQLLDGFWSQACWAWASLTMICALLVALACGEPWEIGGILCVIGVYSYLLPALAHRLLPARIHVRLRDWLVLPLAIALKGIGPNLFLWEKICHRDVVFQKVER